MNYSTIPTVVGAAKLRNASLLGQKVDITRVAFGDGDGAEYEPTGQETALKKQVYECPPNRIEEEAGAPTWIELEAVIPHNVGGWYLREVGCFDDEGDLIFIGNLPSSFKPSGEVNVIKDLVFEMVYDAVAADVVQIKIDPNVVIATRKYVDEQNKVHADSIDPHPQYAKDEDLAKHLNANNPHPQYVNKNEQSVMNLFWENQNFNVPGKDGTLTEVEQTFTVGQEFSKGWFVKSGTLIASLSGGRLVRNGHSTAVIARKYKKNKSGLPKASELIASIEGKDGQRRYSTDVDEITIGEDSTHVWMDINTQPTYYDIGAPCLSHQKAPPLPLSDVDSAKTNIVPLITTEEGWGNGVLLDWSNTGYKTSDLKGLLIVAQVLTGTVTMQGEYSQFHPSSRAIGNRLFGIVMNDPEPLSNYTVMGGIEEVTDTTAKTFLFDVGYTGLVFGVYGVL